MCIRRYKDEVFSECKFPELESKYDRALKEAIRYILKKFSVQGIILTGSIIQGTYHKSSDLDIFVITSRYERQRIQKYFNNIPCEIFISTAQIIKKEIDEGSIMGICTTADMFYNGFTIYDQNQLVYKLKNKAKDVIVRGPVNTKIKMQTLKYKIADMYENALDIKDTDPYMSLILISDAVIRAIKYSLRESGKWEPKAKYFMQELEKHNIDLFSDIKLFYNSNDFQEKFNIAERIIDNTIKERGFFEWESELEIHKP